MNTLTGWAKRLISEIYQTANPETKRIHDIKPHQVRSLTTSLAEAAGASIDNIMKAGMWTNLIPSPPTTYKMLPHSEITSRL